MRRICWLGLVLLVMTGCKTKIPDDIIQPQKIRAVLYDMHIIDGYISTIPNPNSAKRIGAAYYKGFYKKYDIDSVTYTRSMNYYFDHPESLGSIYKDVTARLQKSKDSIDKIEAKIAKKAAAAKKAKQDSINKADPGFMARLAAAKKVTKDSLEKVQQEFKLKMKKDSLNRAKAARKDSVEHARAARKAKAATAAKKTK